MRSDRMGRPFNGQLGGPSVRQHGPRRVVSRLVPLPQGEVHASHARLKSIVLGEKIPQRPLGEGQLVAPPTNLKGGHAEVGIE